MNQSDDTANAALQNEIAELEALAGKGVGAKLAAYSKKCGPGWLQGAITLGGGSLSGSLYLGIIMGYEMMWLQPLAMILGVIMLSAISYVTLSTGLRPFGAVNRHVSPALGWAWLIATLMANIVWCLPQFSLATAAVKQNLAPGIGLGDYVICLVILAITYTVVVLYQKAGIGIKIFEVILKIMVAIIVLCFIGVVGKMTLGGNLPWGEIFAGLIPDFSLLSKPAPLYEQAVAETGAFADYWQSRIVADQTDKMITAFATAVGINMTFLLPYSMLKKGWGKSHRGLAIFDLSTGLVIPFVIATGCVVIAAAAQFHGKYNDVLPDMNSVNPKMAGAYNKILNGRLAVEHGEALAGMALEQKRTLRTELPDGDKKLAAMLVNRDAFQLADSLKPITGDTTAQYVFGIGVLGMAVSTIIILMLISGFTFCEMLGAHNSRAVHLIGALVAGGFGSLAPFIWKGDAKLALAIPTSVIGGALLPIAYLTFLLLMNSKSLLGDNIPGGGKRVIWNLLMLVATSIATFASVWVLKGKSFFNFPIGPVFIGVLALLFILGIIGFLTNSRKSPSG